MTVVASLTNSQVCLFVRRQGRDPSTPQSDSLRDSLYSAQDDRGPKAFSAFFEDPGFTHQKIRQGAKADRHCVGDQVIHVAKANHNFHQGQVADDGDSAVGEVEAQKAEQRATPVNLITV